MTTTSPGAETGFRGARIRYVPVSDVRDGDRIACWLSDATAYPTVTGRRERVLELSRYGLEDVTHVTFRLAGTPWWVDEGFARYNSKDTVPVYLGEA